MANSPTPDQFPQPAGSSSVRARNPTTSRKHPNYRGIRSRSGKWVSEIREPRKTTRIWLGTHPTPEMAAAAYDVAAIALKGPEYSVPLNFPELVSLYPVPVSTSPTDIRNAAVAAAALKQPRPWPEGADLGLGSSSSSTSAAHATAVGWMEEEGTKEGDGMFVDEEELLDMNFMVDMAGAMMVSPPRTNKSPPPPDDSPDGRTIWSYP